MEWTQSENLSHDPLLHLPQLATLSSSIHAYKETVRGPALSVGQSVMSRSVGQSVVGWALDSSPVLENPTSHLIFI